MTFDPTNLMNPLGWKGGPLGVFLLFVIPVGGGIPAGVLMGKANGVSWQMMEGLYFVSDLLLACAFEPVLRFLISAGRTHPRLGRVTSALKAVVRQTIANFGSTGGPFALILIAFGVDPMTGRAATAAVGHGFVAGWTLAIIGDMMYFTMIMASTLWLNGILGDGTKTMIIIMVAMFFLPGVIRKFRERRGR